MTRTPETYVHVQKRVDLLDRRSLIHSIDDVVSLLEAGRIGVEENPHTEIIVSLKRERDRLDWEVHRDSEIAHAVDRVRRNKMATTRVEDEGMMLRDALAAADRSLDKTRTHPYANSDHRPLKFYTDPDPNKSDLFSDDGPRA